MVADFADWEYAQEIIRRYDLENRTRAILISPAWNSLDLALLAEQVAGSGLKVRLQLQLHKYIWGPNTRGV